ncbi:branched-chain amino acid transport system II carrier protein [Propionimicrobium lymphophilum]|uniref:branched-chain amino acid transport system II carrier protein n=1 Tax=Propionimicrobium lymphophilum TaxID=33012 RepID=UPI003EC79E01
MRNSKPYVIAVTGLALFAMFFGAGNLIFPVMIGYQSGTNVLPAIAGFLLTGVLLPVFGIIGSAREPDKVGGIADRIGRIPGKILLIAIFLSTGVLYAVPRVAAVSFEIGIAPLIGDHQQLGLLIYSVIFFGLCFWLTFNENRVVENIGTWLTPILLVFLIILIINCVLRLASAPLKPDPTYVDSPMLTGLLQGYFTMDALAALVFGIVIITSLRRNGFDTKKKLFRATAISGIIAGVCLALVYLGLTAIGTRITGKEFDNGASGLAYAASLMFGRSGQIIFGIIAFFACLTTAVGLIGASTSYFKTMYPKVPRKTMLIIHIAIALVLSNLGLTMILKIVAPLNQFIYPAAICLIVLAVIDWLIPGSFHWTYRLSAWTAAFIAFFDALWTTNLPVFEGLGHFLNSLPGGPQHMEWAPFTLVALIIGLIIDAVQGRLTRANTPEAELSSN